MNIPLAFSQQTLLVACLMLFFGVGHAQLQTNWDKTYGAESWEQLNGLVSLPDGYMLGGCTQSGTLTSVKNDTAYDFHLVRTNITGNQVWSQSYGGRQRDWLWNMIQTSDGNFLMVGASKSDISTSKSQNCRGDEDYWLIKVDQNGNKIWDKTYGGDTTDVAFSVKELKNGDLLVAGMSWSGVGGDKSDACRGMSDLWLLLLDRNGDLKWQQTVGGDLREFAYDMVLSSDERYVYVAGGTASDPTKSPEIGTDSRRGGMDFWVLKFDLDNQSTVWSRRFGGGGIGKESYAYRIIMSFDGSLIVGGYSEVGISSPGNSNNGKNSPFHGGKADYWVFKIDKNGNKVPGFDQSFGGTGLDVCYGLYENFFGDLYVVGVTDSGVSGTKKTEAFGFYDVWVIYMDRNWKEITQKSYGGDDWDSASRIVAKTDGSLAIGGHSMSNRSGTKSDNSFGFNDLWLITTSCGTMDGAINAAPYDPCVEQTITLQAGSDTCATCVYFWSTGDQGALLDIPPGYKDSVSVLVARRDGCLMWDTIFANNPIPPVIDLGPIDTAILEGQSLIIGGNNPEISYLWGNGDTSASIVVTHSGVWALTVTDANGCTANDWMRIKVVEKEAVYIPNVFTPDFNGQNDYFNVYADASVESVVRLEVFDRWGALLFTRSDYPPNYETDGWDGTFHGRRMSPGNYKYYAIVKFIDQSEKIYTGMVTIVR
jgi:gliding motility-associated-like protein